MVRLDTALLRRAETRQFAPDPSLLPVASGQAANNAAYDALGIPSCAAGSWYHDPATNALVYKVTDDSSDPPYGVIPPYSEFGPHISNPWTDPAGDTMYTLMLIGGFGNAKLVDFNYTVAVAITGNPLSSFRSPPWGELHAAFSFNPATPRIAYFVDGGSVRRYDTAAMTDANTGNFPGPFLGVREFMIDQDDAWMSARDNDASQTVRTWNALTNQSWDWGGTGNEAHLDRTGRYIYGVNSSTDFVQGTLSAGPPWSDVFPANFAASHNASAANGLMIAADPTTAGGPTLEYWDPMARARTFLGSAGEGCWGHGAAQWVHGNGSGLQQWVVSSSYKAAGCANLADAIGYFRFDDTGLANVRLLAHHYSAGAGDEYFNQPHATISPDGKLVMWGSDMNQGAGRSLATFVAIVPTR